MRGRRRERKRSSWRNTDGAKFYMSNKKGPGYKKNFPPEIWRYHRGGPLGKKIFCKNFAYLKVIPYICTNQKLYIMSKLSIGSDVRNRLAIINKEQEELKQEIEERVEAEFEKEGEALIAEKKRLRAEVIKFKRSVPAFLDELFRGHKIKVITHGGPMDENPREQIGWFNSRAGDTCFRMVTPERSDVFIVCASILSSIERVKD